MSETFFLGHRYGGPVLLGPVVKKSSAASLAAYYERLSLVYDYSSACLVWVRLGAHGNSFLAWTMGAHVSRNKSVATWMEIARILMANMAVLAELELLSVAEFEALYPRHVLPKQK